jgi:hypothetical protein
MTGPRASLKQQNRHCERSEAIHSFFARNDGLLRFARNDGHNFAFSRRHSPEVCIDLVLFENRGRREDRVRAAPAVSCAMCTKKCAHEHTGSAESIRPSLRNGFTAYGALSPATNSSCHRRRRIEGLVAPGWANIASADLTPATGARTTRFCRTLWRRRPALTISLTGQARPAIPLHADAAASTASHRAFRDDRDPPLFSGETGGEVPLICPMRASRIFSYEGIDRFY